MQSPWLRRRIGFLLLAAYLGDRHSILVPLHTPRVLVPVWPAEMKRERQCRQCRFSNVELGIDSTLAIRNSPVTSLGLYPQL